MRKVIALCFVMILLTGASAYAQINAKTYSISPFIGGYTFEGSENQRTSPVAGLRMGYDLTRHLGIEALLEYTRSKYSKPPAAEESPSIFGYRLEGLYHFMPESRLVPFVALGAGGRSIRFKDLPLDKNHVAVDYGVGLKYFLLTDLALRADVRHIFLLSDNLNNLEYTLGISYYFGGPKPAKAEPAPRVLPAPVNLSAKAASRSQINLAWSKVPGANVYKVYRDGSYLYPTQDATVPDKELKASTQYCYQVTVLDDAMKESARSNEACATTPAPPPPPPPKVLPAPVNLSAKAASRSQIDLAWNKVPGANVYKVYRDGSYLYPTNSAALPDKEGVKASTRYCYQVTVLDDAMRESTRSNEACATTPAPPPPPPPKVLPAPVNLSAKAASRSQIDLAWDKVPGANVYKIYRDGSYLYPTNIAALPDKEGVKASTRYCYQVTALDDAMRESARSNEACATTPAPPPPPPPPPVAKAEQAPASAVAKEMLEKGRATINIEFDTNKADIKAKYHEEIKKFADVMKQYPDLKVVIEGHTDNVGGNAFNQKLSQRRAESVKTYMVKTFGIDETRLTAKGYGMSKPIDSNKTPKGRQKNRRVEAAVDYTFKKK